MDNYTKTFLIVIVTCLMTSISHSNEIFSCKQISEATIKSDKSYGFSLHGKGEFERTYMAKQEPQILIFNNQEMITFDGKKYSLLGGSGHKYYENSYWGLIEVYDKKNSEVTLFHSRSNGYNSQMNLMVMGLLQKMCE